MQIELLMDSAPNLTDWLQAVGTVGALIVTSALALLAWVGELQRRGERTVATLFIVENAAAKFSQFLEHLDEEIYGGVQLDGTKAAAFQVDGGLQEVLAVLAEVRPVDMPSVRTAAAYMNLRGAVRSVEASLAWNADRPGRHPFPGLKPVKLAVRSAYTDFNSARARYKHPLLPAAVVEWRRERLNKARDRKIALEKASKT